MNNKNDLKKQVADGIREQKGREDSAGCLGLVGLVGGIATWTLTGHLFLGIAVLVVLVGISIYLYWK